MVGASPYPAKRQRLLQQEAVLLAEDLQVLPEDHAKTRIALRIEFPTPHALSALAADDGLHGSMVGHVGTTPKEESIMHTNDQDSSAEVKASEFTPIESQEDLDRIIGERLARQKAQHEKAMSRFADYDELKAKADEAQILKAATATQEEKTNAALAELNKRLEASEARAKAAEQEALRSSVAAQKNVPVKLLPADADREAMEAAADALNEWAKSAGTGGLGPGMKHPGGAGEAAGKNGGTAAGRELFTARHRRDGDA